MHLDFFFFKPLWHMSQSVSARCKIPMKFRCLRVVSVAIAASDDPSQREVGILLLHVAWLACAVDMVMQQVDHGL